MFFKILNSIPVIGHIKGVAHYVVGDFAGGNTAMYESTRSGIVLAGGLVGSAGGPAGSAVGAVLAGTVLDTVTSLVTGTPERVLAGLGGVASDVASGRLPVEPLAQLAISVTSDAIGGLGGGTVAETVTRVIVTGTKVGGKLSVVVAKDRVKFALQSVFTYCFARALVTRRAERGGGRPAQTNNTSKKKKSKSEDGATNSGSASDPPEKNQNTTTTEPAEVRETHWNALLKIFKASSLDDIFMGTSSTPIFKNLEDGQRRSLKKLISAIRRHGDTYFVRIVRIVAKMFDRLDEKHVTFQNFISLVNFVMTYVGEAVAERNERRRGGGGDAEATLAPFEDRLGALTDLITSELVGDISALWVTYNNLRNSISCQWIRMWPSFRNVVSAVYHFYKHRLMAERVMSVEEYFGLIESFLERVHGLDEFFELDGPRRELVYERYLASFGRRGRLVLQVQDDNLELSSFYFLDFPIEGDRDGDEYVDGVKIQTEE